MWDKERKKEKEIEREREKERRRGREIRSSTIEKKTKEEYKRKLRGKEMSNIFFTNHTSDHTFSLTINFLILLSPEII